MVGRMTGRIRLLVRALVLLVAGVTAWRMLSPISTPPFRAGDGPILCNSIAVIGRWPIHGVDQSVIIRGRDHASPILLFVHGGPGSSETAALEDHFVMAYWDQRNAG